MFPCAVGCRQGRQLPRTVKIGVFQKDVTVRSPRVPSAGWGHGVTSRETLKVRVRKVIVTVRSIIELPLALGLGVDGEAVGVATTFLHEIYPAGPCVF